MKKSKLRYVVKLGTRVLSQEDGGLAEDRVLEFLKAIAKSKKQNKEFVLVSSGAVGLGRKELGLGGKLELAEKQACAAVGQVRLMETYKRLGQKCGLKVAQILVTHSDISDRNKYLNLRESLEKLLELDVLPVLNENDPVSVEEIRETTKDKSFGDNDRLSAIIASKLEADMLILLTDVEGVFSENPKKSKKAQILKEISDLKTLAVDLSGKSDTGRGGMASKLQASGMAALAGVPTLIASGLEVGVLEDLLEDPASHGTFIKATKKISSRRRWIGLSSGFSGVITINEGAQEALEKKGASLLPAGVVEVVGDFKKGDVIQVRNQKGEELGRGISGVDSETGRSILGKKSSEIKKLFPKEKIDDFIHRDNLVIFTEVSHEPD